MVTDESSECDGEAAAMDPDQLQAMIARLVFTGEPLANLLAPDTAADREAGMWPRPVAMLDDLDLRCQVRASELGLSRSAYVRQLIEKDLKAAYGGDLP